MLELYVRGDNGAEPKPHQQLHRQYRCMELFGVVAMANRLEHESIGAEPEDRVISWVVLREFSRLVHDLAPELPHSIVHSMDRGAVDHGESQMVQPAAQAGVIAVGKCRIKNSAGHGCSPTGLYEN